MLHLIKINILQEDFPLLRMSWWFSHCPGMKLAVIVEHTPPSLPGSALHCSMVANNSSYNGFYTTQVTGDLNFFNKG